MNLKVTTMIDEANDINELVRLSNLPYASIKSFLTFIDAPEDLYGIQAVLFNLNKLLFISNQIDYHDLERVKNELLNCSPIISQLITSVAENPIPTIWQSHGKTRRDNLIGKHPVYAMLTNDSVQYENTWGELKDGLTLLMFMIVRSYNELLNKGEISRANQNQTIGTRAIRELEQVENRKYLPPSPFEFDHLKDYCTELERWNENHHLKWANNFLAMAETLLSKKEGYTRRYKTNYSHQSVVRTKVQESEEDYEHQLVEQLLARDILDEKSEKSAARLGNHPAEFDKVSFTQIAYKQEDFALRNAKMQIGRAAGQIHAMISSAQQIRYTNSELTKRELEILIKEITGSNDDLNSKPSLLPCGKYELFSLLLLAVFTGRTLESIQTLRFSTFRNFYHTKIKELTWCVDKEILYIPTHQNDVYSRLSSELKALIKFSNLGHIPDKSTAYYAIQLPEFVTKMLNNFYLEWKSVVKEKKKSGKKNFAWSMAFLQNDLHSAAILKSIKRINQQYKTNITFQKILASFRQTVFSVNQDQALYTYITGINYNHGVVSTHYYAVQRADLSVIHNQSINFILSSIGLNPNNIPVDQVDSFSIGSKFPLSSETVQLFVNDLKLRLKNAIRMNKLSHIHNAYTTYILSMLSYCTGYRAVKDPVDHCYQVNQRFGFLVISDKDDDSNYHSRIIPLTELVLNQIQEYQRYLKHLYTKLSLTPYTQKNVFELIHQSEKCHIPFFFYLTDQNRVSSISPKTYKEHIDPTWAFPINVNRHYLRSQLANENCPSEYIDYFMGHWEFGEEPFNKFSYVSPQMIKEHVTPLIEKMMHKDGWRLIKHPYA